MKKLIIILISILVLVWIGLSVISSSSDYNAEKLLYKAVTAGQKIARNPDVVPPGAAAQVEKNLRMVIERYSASPVALVARMKLAEFYLMIKKYDKSVEAADKIINLPDIGPVFLSQALFLKGSAYEKKGEWAKALRTYNTLRDRCPETPLGLQSPLYVAGYYERNGKSEDASAAYREAARFYRNMTAGKKPTVAGYWASEYLLKAYISLKEYEEAGKTAKEIIAVYPSRTAYLQNLPAIELIYLKQLNRPEEALKIYKEVLAKTNDRQLKGVLSKKIEQLEKAK